jgi:hypothetical protein
MFESILTFCVTIVALSVFSLPGEWKKKKKMVKKCREEEEEEEKLEYKTHRWWPITQRKRKKRWGPVCVRELLSGRWEGFLTVKELLPARWAKVVSLPSQPPPTTCFYFNFFFKVESCHWFSFHDCGNGIS